jgi:hypothetical protein
MPKCRFCDRDNPVGVDRCQNCGVWIDQATAPIITNSERHPEALQDAEKRLEPDGLEAQILDLMQGGKKIEAIKLYREKTGSDLKGAKDAVEALAAQHGMTAKGSGCAGVVLTVFFALGLLAMNVWLMTT